MKKPRLIDMLYACGFMLLVTSSSYADTIKVDLTGSVTSIGGSSGPTNGVFSPGDAISYSFEFEEATTASSSGVVRYLYSITSFSGDVGGYLFSGSSGDAFLRNDGTAGTIFGGNPYDQVTINNLTAAVYDQAYGGFDREDFASTSGNVAGVPLRSVSIHAQTDDTTLLSDLNFSEEALISLSDNLSLLSFSMLFMDGAFGSAPVSVNGSFNGMTVTNLTSVPVPAAAWLFGSGLLGLIGMARRKKAA